MAQIITKNTVVKEKNSAFQQEKNTTSVQAVLPFITLNKKQFKMFKKKGKKLMVLIYIFGVTGGVVKVVGIV